MGIPFSSFQKPEFHDKWRNRNYFSSIFVHKWYFCDFLNNQTHHFGTLFVLLIRKSRGWFLPLTFRRNVYHAKMFVQVRQNRRKNVEKDRRRKKINRTVGNFSILLKPKRGRTSFSPIYAINLARTDSSPCPSNLTQVSDILNVVSTIEKFEKRERMRFTRLNSGHRIIGVRIGSG